MSHILSPGGPAVVVIVTGLVFGCAGRQEIARVPDGTFVITPTARDIRHTSEYDGAVYYVVDEPHPGEATIAYIDVEMAKAGWRQSPVLLYPTEHAVERRTWWSYGDGPEKKVHQWNGTWANSSGALVTYVLRYEVSPPGAPRRELRVIGIYTEAATVDAMRKAAGIK